MLERIITGGQTGADQAALRAACAAGLATGGWAPAGWATEEGPALGLAFFGLVELPGADDATRRRWLAVDASGRLSQIGEQSGPERRWYGARPVRQRGTRMSTCSVPRLTSEVETGIRLAPAARI